MTDIAHKTLAEALVAFQTEAPTLAKDATNPHFRSKFTPLDTIVQTVRPLLAKHGLSWSTFPCFGPNGEPALRYKLTHVSGDCESDTMPLLVQKLDPQGQGSALTYARRYSICAVLNLVSDEDDDGNSGSRPPSPPGATARDVEELRAAARGLKGTQVRAALASCGIQAPPNIRNAFDHVPAAKTAILAECLAGIEREETT